LTLDDAVKAALDHNLDIAVQRLNPEIQDISYASLKSVYLPSLTSQLSAASQTMRLRRQWRAVARRAQPSAPTDLFNGGRRSKRPVGWRQFQRPAE
jgi:hypothetical protein